MADKESGLTKSQQDVLDWASFSFADRDSSRTELESGHTLCAFLQAQAPVLDKMSGPMGVHNVYPVLGWGLAPSYGERNFSPALALDKNQSPIHIYIYI